MSENSVCSGTEILFSAKTSDNGFGTSQWSTNDVQTTLQTQGLSASLLKNVNNITEITALLDYTSEFGCQAKQKQVEVTINPIPEKPIVHNVSYCVDAVAEQLTATALGELLWWGTNASGGTSSAMAPTPSTATEGVTKYYVSQRINGCESERAEITVTVNAKLSPEIVIANANLCEGETTDVSLSQTYKTVNWSGTASSQFDDILLAAPKFTAATVSSATEYKVVVGVTDNNGCEGSSSKTITVNPVPTVKISTLENACVSNSTTQNIEATILPLVSGIGTWSGVTKRSETEAQFTPSDAGVGKHSISYSFVSDAGCSAKQAASTEVEVFALPEIVLTPSVEHVCESGSAVQNVTLKVSGSFASTGEKTPTYDFSSATLTGVNATTGEFLVAGQTAETHSISLNFSDANGCEATAQTSVKVFARPIADISANPESLCDYDNPITLVAKIDGVATTQGTFVGTGVTDFTFTPNSQIKGSNVLTYTFIDQNGCAAQSVQHTISVHHIDEPLVQSISASKLDVTSQETVPDIMAMGTDIRWYNNAELSSAPTQASSFKTPFTDTDADGKMDVGVYTIWATQTANGCESLPAEASLTITDCEAKAPSAEMYHACQGSTDDILVTATSNQVSATNFCWFAAREDIPAGTVATINDVTKLASGESYSVPSANFTTKGTMFVYVAEFYEHDHCFSAPTPVQITVHEVPQPIISDVGIICSTAESFPITYAPTSAGNVTSTLLGDGISGDIWTPQFNASTTGVTETSIQLTTQEVWSPTIMCQNSVSKTLQVINVLPPTANGVEHPLVWSSEKLESLPAMEINFANDLGATLRVTNNVQTEIATSSPMQLYPTHIQGEGDYQFKLTQTLNGCSSSEAISNWKIVDCPTLAPQANNVELCYGDDLPTITAQGSGTMFEWFQNDVKIASSASLNLESLGIDFTPDKYTFKVRQNGDDGAGGMCFGPFAEVTLTVNALPTITFAENASTTCYSTASERIDVTVHCGTNGEGSGEWSISGDNSALSSSGIFYPQRNGKTSDTYTITYAYTDGKSCKNSAQRTISVVYLEQPQVSNFYAIVGQNIPVELSLNETPKADILWFASESSVANALANETTFTPNLTTNQKTEQDFYVRYTKQSCFSEPTTAHVSVVDCPIPEVTVNSVSACDYENVPAISITSNGWAERNEAKSVYRIYTANQLQTNQFIESTSMQFEPPQLAEGIHTFYVTEYNSLPLSGLTVADGCESKPAKVNVTIIATPAPMVISPSNQATVCFGDENPRFTVNNPQGTILWYEDFPAEKGVPSVAQSDEGFTFVPQNTSEGMHSVWAIQLLNGCYSPRTEVQYRVKPIPNEPTTSSVSVCKGDNPQQFEASGEANAIFVWFADKQKNMELLRNSATYMPRDVVEGTHTYFVAQVVDGCVSQTSEAQFVIKPLPLFPILNPQNNICEYDPMPTLHASGENIAWYASDQITLLANGNDFTPEKSANGLCRLYVSQTVDDCESAKASISFNINAKPAAPTPQGNTMCEGDTIIPTLTSHFSIDKWYADINCQTLLAEGREFTPQADMVNNVTTTFYVARNQSGCISDVVPVELIIIPQPTFSIGSDIVACEYDSIREIQATEFEPAINENSYIGWTVSQGKNSKVYTDNKTHSLVADVITAPKTYTISAFYRYKYGNATCNSKTETILYTLKPRAHTPIVFNSVICQGEDIQDLRAIGSKNMEWQSLSGTKPEHAIGTRYKFEDKQLAVGEYTFEIFDRTIIDAENDIGCESLRDTVVLTVAPAAHAQIFGVDSVCAGETQEYFTNFTPQSSYWWKVTGDNLNYSKDQNTSSVRYVDWLEEGVDTITVFEQTWAGCQAADTLVVKVAPIPQAAFSWTMPGSINIIELKDSTRQDSLHYVNYNGDLVVEAIPYTLAWNFGHQGQSEAEIDSIVPYKLRNYPIVEENYSYGYNCPILTVTNLFGCSHSYTECVFVDVVSSLFIPNAFSPSNAALGVRTFKPKGFNLKTCEVSVYDKWGNLIWFSNKVENGMFADEWDGMYNGTAMQSGVYVWKIEASFLDGQDWAGQGSPKSKFGSVTLIR